MEELALVLKKLGKMEAQMNELSNIIKADRKTELNVKEAAAFLGVAPKTVHNYLASRRLFGFKRGKFRYFYKSELEVFKSNFNQ